MSARTSLLPTPGRFCIALAYARGEKTEYIAARFRLGTRSLVSHVASAFGLPMRSARHFARPSEQESRTVLAEFARKRALSLETEAKVWRALAKQAIPTNSR